MKDFQKGFSALLLIVLLALVTVVGIYIYKNKKVGSPVSVNTEKEVKKNEGPKSNLLSKTAFTNDKFGVKMYPPNGWYAKQDDFFNAQIMFLDQPQGSISDFSNQNAIITLAIYPNDDLSFSPDKYIDEIEKEMKDTEESSSGDSQYSLFKTAVANKETVIVDGIQGITYDFGSYFGGIGIGKTIVFSKDKKLFVIIAEVQDENAWIQNKEKIVQSMMSFKLIK
mgnify:CR=1 FL=1